jgi:hypothetical protein
MNDDPINPEQAVPSNARPLPVRQTVEFNRDEALWIGWLAKQFEMPPREMPRCLVRMAMRHVVHDPVHGGLAQAIAEEQAAETMATGHIWQGWTE